MLQRRAFIAALLGGAVLDPEKLLWVPGWKLISIPAPRLGPFHVWANFPETDTYASYASVWIEQLMNRRWAADPAFRLRLHRGESARDLMNEVIRDTTPDLVRVA
jgi:hypothetical protein